MTDAERIAEGQRCRKELAKLGIRVVWFPIDGKFYCFRDNLQVGGEYQSVFHAHRELMPK